MAHGVFQWNRMFETRNNPRCMVPVLKSLRTLEPRPSLELGERIEESVLGGKGDRKRRHGSKRITYPNDLQPIPEYTLPATVSMGIYEGCLIFSLRSDYYEIGSLDHRASRLFIFHADTDCGGQAIRSLVAEMN